MKVAFATTDLERINDHFGWAKQFAIYEIHKEGFELVGVVKTQEDMTEEHEKIRSKIDAIKDVAIVYCEAIGPTAAAKVIQSRIHPMKVAGHPTIRDAAGELVLNAGQKPASLDSADYRTGGCRMTPYMLELIAQLRALDPHGMWSKLDDVELLAKKYIKTKEDLKSIPIIADITEAAIKDIRILFQALALAFERITGVMCTVVMEMSHEGFGRCVVIANDIVIASRYFKDAHRFGFRDLDALSEEGEKMMRKALETFDKYRSAA